jgi:hypothetical protein
MSLALNIFPHFQMNGFDGMDVVILYISIKVVVFYCNLSAILSFILPPSPLTGVDDMNV